MKDKNFFEGYITGIVFVVVVVCAAILVRTVGV